MRSGVSQHHGHVLIQPKAGIGNKFTIFREYVKVVEIFFSISILIEKRCERHGIQLIQPKAVSGPQILSSLPSGPKGKRTERKRHRTQNPLFFHGKKTDRKRQKNMYP